MPRVLLTRARAQAEAFAVALRAETALEPVFSPMLEMQDLAVKLDLSGISALAFTSQNGVEAFARQSPIRLPAYCVGEATAARARALGFEAMAAAGNAESLRDILPESGVLHLHGRHVIGALGVKALAIYDQRALPLSKPAIAMLKAGELDAIALFSPRSSKLLVQSWQANWPKIPQLYALSEAVAAPLAPLGVAKICAAPRAESMLRLLSADYPA